MKKNLKGSLGKRKVTYKSTPIRLAVDFSPETPQARREGNDIQRVERQKLPAKYASCGTVIL